MRGNWIAGFVWDSVLQRVGATWRIACLLFLGDNGQGQAFLLYQGNKKASEVLGWNVWENWIFQHWRWLKGRLGTCLGGLLYFVFTFIFCSTSEIAKCIGRIRKLVFWKCLWYFQSWEWLTENGDDAVVVC